MKSIHCKTIFKAKNKISAKRVVKKKNTGLMKSSNVFLCDDDEEKE